MRMHELTLAKDRQNAYKAEAADRRLGSVAGASTGRTGLIQVWTAVRATLTAPSPTVAR